MPNGGLASCRRVGSTQLSVQGADAEPTCVLKNSEPRRGCTDQQSEAHSHSTSDVVLRILKPDFWYHGLICLQLLTHCGILGYMEIHDDFP